MNRIAILRSDQLSARSKAVWALLAELPEDCPSIALTKLDELGFGSASTVIQALRRLEAAGLIGIECQPVGVPNRYHLGDCEECIDYRRRLEHIDSTA